MDPEYTFQREVAFRHLVRRLLSDDVKPTPKVLQTYGFGNGNNLSANFVEIRTQEFERAGWFKKSTGRWSKPRPQ